MHRTKMAPELRETLKKTQPDEMVRAILTLRENPDKDFLKKIEELGVRVRYVYKLVPGVAVEAPARVLKSIVRRKYVERIELDKRVVVLDR